MPNAAVIERIQGAADRAGSYRHFAPWFGYDSDCLGKGMGYR